MADFYCDQVLTGKVPVRVVFETPLVLAFHHTDPYWEVHVVIIPKEHLLSLASYAGSPELTTDLFEAMRVVTKQLEDRYGACRISSNVGSYQTTKHLHWYVHYGARRRAENGKPIG